MSNPYAPPDPAKPRPERPATPPRGGGPSGGPHAPRQLPPAKPPLTPEQIAATSRSLTRFGLLMLAAVLTSRLPLPWQAAAPFFAGGAIVVGTRALLAARRAGMRGLGNVMLTFGIALSGVLLLSSLTLLSAWPLQVERQQCLDSALTISAEARCEAAFQDALRERMNPQGNN